MKLGFPSNEKMRKSATAMLLVWAVLAPLAASAGVTYGSSSEPSESPLEIVQLKNGAEMPRALAKTGMLLIFSLANSSRVQDKLLLYELVEKCRNPDHVLSKDVSAELEALTMVRDGHVVSNIENLILSAVSVVDGEFRMQNPLLEDCSDHLKPPISG